MFKKILIANRGEIACRIARTLRRMGIQVATVHSRADDNALHVREIGESVCIGEGPARESYLDVEAVLNAAQRVGADAIHPGYGFLSENPLMARRCTELGITFIGPSADTLELFGDKASAKRLAQSLGVPTAGGLLEPSEDIDEILRAVHALPLPCIVKAVAGGGGKGMRVLRSADDARESIAQAMREGRSSFGDGRVMVERYLVEPRHLEVQVLGDGQGGVIHLYDRECSLQRRHQKVVEEAPVSSIPDTIRAALWEHACRLAEEANYLGLGTVEFAVTGEEYVFLEINPRLQVEHPVTECVLGLDLIELQVRTVFNRRLPLIQDDIPAPNGYAVQARLYAEDPDQGFLPSTGTLRKFRAGAGVRCDTGVQDGSEITPHYDPMVAKLIAHAPTRTQCLEQLSEALSNTVVLGVTSNRNFLLSLLADEHVIANRVNTETLDHWLASRADTAVTPQQAAALMALWRQQIIQRTSADGAWRDAGLAGWRLRRHAGRLPPTDQITLRHELRVGKQNWKAGFGITLADGSWPVRIDDAIFRVVPGGRAADGRMSIEVDGCSLAMDFTSDAGRLWAVIGDLELAGDVQPVHDMTGSSEEGAAGGTVLAPMMGMIVALHVEEGEMVEPGTRLATLESMKMELALIAETAGEVAWIGCEIGTKVERNQALFRITAEAEPCEA